MSYWQYEVNTTEHINASPEKIYSILTDFDSYPSWNPFLIKITTTNNSPLAVGNTIQATINTNHKKDDSPPSLMNFSPSIDWVEENKGFQWTGKLGFGGMFDGAHRFEIKPSEDGKGSVLEHKEQFSGCIIWLGGMTGGGWFTHMMENTKTGFTRMNQALKEKAEQQ